MPVQLHKHFVEDFIWTTDGEVDFSDFRDLAAVEHALPSLSGHFALHVEDRGRHLFARDPLGVNKLFVAVNGRKVISSNYLFDLLHEGNRIEQITSVPSGYSLCVDSERRLVQGSKYSTLSFDQTDNRAGRDSRWGDEPAHIERIRTTLNAAFQKIQKIAADRATYVTMSGGLDSTIIALLARDHVSHVQGVTLSVVDRASSIESEDVRYARKVARDLDIPLTVLTVTAEEILALVDDVLKWGQDWRDFNVHCGLVNSALGRGLADRLTPDEKGRRPLLLTGDTMNEMMADYSPVPYAGRDQYPLPRLDWAQRRRFLVSGLDSGDREVGILARLGFSTIQPYAIAAPAYLALPPRLLEQPDSKQLLAKSIFGDRIPEYVLKRPKVRAQVGDSTRPAGTMAVLLDAGLDGAFLRNRWCELFSVRPETLNNIIQAGLYRYSTAIC